MDSWSSSKAAQFLVGYYYYGHANTNIDLTAISADIVKALSLDDLSILDAAELATSSPTSRAGRSTPTTWDEVKAS